MSGRVLLEADNDLLFRQELQQALGGVKVGRLRVVDQTATLLTITPLPVLLGQVIRIRTVVLGRQVGGSAGTVGDVGSWEITGTFKNLSGTLAQVDATVTVASEDNTDIAPVYTISSNVLSLDVQFTGGSTNYEYVFNSYSYIHVLSES